MPTRGDGHQQGYANMLKVDWGGLEAMMNAYPALRNRVEMRGQKKTRHPSAGKLLSFHFLFPRRLFFLSDDKLNTPRVPGALCSRPFRIIRQTLF